MWWTFAGGWTAFVATGLLATISVRIGFGDTAAPDEVSRKLQRCAVPPIGGLAIGCAWLLCGGPNGIAGVLPGWFGAQSERVASLPAWFASPCSSACALAAALTVGFIDDVRPTGLGPRAKLIGQALAGALLALPTWTALPFSAALGWTGASICGALLACNLWNTLDHADGVAGGLAGTGLALLRNPAAAAVIGFLPWNLVLRRAGEPRAYLGDGGSHLLGMAILVEPAAWPLAVLPALDLIRVCVLRRRAGQTLWVGDRRHIAHVLEARGLGRKLVAACVVALGVLPLVLMFL